MALIDLIRGSRSCRRFDQKAEIGERDMELLAEAARFTPSSRNIQPIRYITCTDREMNRRIFGTLAWAGYYTDWEGPEEGERPSGYFILVHDRETASGYSCDNGIIAQTVMLQAAELGLAGCIIGAVKKEELAEILGLDTNRYGIINVIALGAPAEKIVIEDMKDNSYRYWRDEKQVHHVPKRTLSELILKKF